MLTGTKDTPPPPHDMTNATDPRPTCYRDALALLEGTDHMTIGRNTMLERIERSSRSMPAIGVRYHATTIVTFYENGVTEITSGGYRTSSTKERLNRYLPSGWRIFQKDYMWMLDTPVGTEEFSDNSVYIDDETADSDAGREVQA